MTARTRRLLEILLRASGPRLVGVAVMTYSAWSANTLGNHALDRRNREANIHDLRPRIQSEVDPLDRRFYQAGLAGEKQDLQVAIRGFQALRAETRPGTHRHLRSSLRRGDRDHARAMRYEALAQDERDGGLGSHRHFAQYLGAIVESGDREAASRSR